MSLGRTPAWQKLYRGLSSIRTGIVLLILIGLASATGTMVLQRPLTDPANLQRSYDPQTLAWLDRLGLTDVFHSWWFITLMGLLCINIILASVERFPTVWRFFSRPYRRPDLHFQATLPLQKEIPIRRPEVALEAAERVFLRLGMKPERVGKNGETSLYIERYRLARLAPYVVHASLLLILAGGIVDSVWGWRGFVALTQNQETNQIELRDGTERVLPFTIRCEDAGQENYPDGTPRRWWTNLTVVEDGREVLRKEIAVNDPLVYRGLRFFQSSYGSTGELGQVSLTATAVADPTRSFNVELFPGRAVALDEATRVRLGAFVPDFVVVGNQIRTRSQQPNNPAIQLVVESKTAGESKVWLFPRFPEFSHPNESPYRFQVRGLQMGYYTGLQVAYEPGQWAVWAGCILMALGLLMAFYMVHVRFWVVPVSDGHGRQVLWVGASASKNRAEFKDRFRRLTEAIQAELEGRQAAAAATNHTLPARS